MWLNSELISIMWLLILCEQMPVAEEKYDNLIMINYSQNIIYEILYISFRLLSIFFSAAKIFFFWYVMKIKCCRLIDFQLFGNKFRERDDDRALDNGQQIAYNSAYFTALIWYGIPDTFGRFAKEFLRDFILIICWECEIEMFVGNLKRFCLLEDFRKIFIVGTDSHRTFGYGLLVLSF